jgi:dihydroneopterin aldolase
VDKIVLEGIDFHGYHGVFEEEARFGSRFTVDVELYCEFPEDDELLETVDYGRIYEVIRYEVTERRYHLIEVLAQRIAGCILDSEPSATRVIARVHKPHAPLPGVLRDIYVEVVRDRVDT